MSPNKTTRLAAFGTPEEEIEAMPSVWGEFARVLMSAQEVIGDKFPEYWQAGAGGQSFGLFVCSVMRKVDSLPEGERREFVTQASALVQEWGSTEDRDKLISNPENPLFGKLVDLVGNVLAETDVPKLSPHKIAKAEIEGMKGVLGDFARVLLKAQLRINKRFPKYWKTGNPDYSFTQFVGDVVKRFGKLSDEEAGYLPGAAQEIVKQWNSPDNKMQFLSNPEHEIFARIEEIFKTMLYVVEFPEVAEDTAETTAAETQELVSEQLQDI